MAKVPAKVPSPKRKVAVSARIKAGKERRIWITILSIRRITAGNPKFAAPKGEKKRSLSSGFGYEISKFQYIAINHKLNKFLFILFHFYPPRIWTVSVIGLS